MFRPLPRTTHVIINPNKTPLNLSFEETRHVYEDSNFKGPDNNGSRQAAPRHADSGVSGVPFGFKKRRRGGRIRGGRRNPASVR